MESLDFDTLKSRGIENRVLELCPTCHDKAFPNAHFCVYCGTDLRVNIHDDAVDSDIQEAEKRIEE